MLVAFEKIEIISSGKVQFFTVRLDENELTEFERFADKERLYDTHAEEMDELNNSIDLMSEKGAKRQYFVPEESFHYLPSVGNEIKDANKLDFGVRLYCIRITDNIVILLNGDVKTTKSAQMCPNVGKLFKISKSISSKITAAIVEKEINLKDENPFDNFYFEI